MAQTDAWGWTENVLLYIHKNNLYKVHKFLKFYQI